MATDSMNPEIATTEDQETATDSMNPEMATTEDQETATDSINSEMATTEDQETATDSMNPEIISGEITGCPKLECQSGIKVSPVVDEKRGTTVSIAGKVIGRLPVLLCQMCTQSAPSHSWVDIMDSIVDFDLEIDLLAAETSNFADQFMEHVGIDLEQFSTQPDPFLEPDPEKVKTEAPSETNVSLQPRFAALISTEKRRRTECQKKTQQSTRWGHLFGAVDQHRRNQASTEKNTLSTVKHGGGSVMLWGCFVSNGTGNLYRVDGIVDSSKLSFEKTLKVKYVDIIDGDLARVPTVVTTCCVLHNVCEEHGENYFNQWNAAPSLQRASVRFYQEFEGGVEAVFWPQKENFGGKLHPVSYVIADITRPTKSPVFSTTHHEWCVVVQPPTRDINNKLGVFLN
ncbi:hypothetical protein Bbelb_048300 [Branchiostoma belcheri]|nr:hypothetical protein Bbelb_048300 [Branchiostoma belcheri]